MNSSSPARELSNSWPRLLQEPLALVSVLMTASKFPGTIALVYFVMRGDLLACGIGILVFIIVDIYDGVLFRRTALGRDPSKRRIRALLDVHSDRFLILGVGTSMFILTDISSFAFWTFMGREALLGILLAAPFYRHNIVYAPNLLSRIATAAMGVYAAFFGFGVGRPVLLVCLWIFVIAGSVGTVRYITNPTFR